MNQIIYPEKIEENLELYKENLLKKKKTYKFLLIFSVATSSIFIGYYVFLFFKISRVQNVAKNILSIYDIQKLYSDNSYMAFPTVISENGDIAEVLGIIEIDKLNLRLPVLSNCTDELLKIAPCKFYGNSLNDSGNFCIAGHNYDNGELFSDLKLLDYGDIINIYPVNGASMSYKIYDIFETDASNALKIEKNFYEKEITLITCNNQNKLRLIIKAKKE